MSYQVWQNGVLVREVIDQTTNSIQEWPLALKPLKLLCRPGDKGLGDIVERVIGPVGGDSYKAWYEKVFGVPCGCIKRIDNLNQRFPLN